MRFLVVDDSATDRELVVRRLRREFPEAEFVQVGRAEQLDQAIQSDHFDIALTDYQLNWANGLEVMNKVKASDPDLPVLMVTGTGSEEIAVEGLRTGLSNYILKQHLDRLPQAIRESLEKVRLQKQYEQAIKQLRLSEERYREIFEQGLAGIYVCTSQGKIVTCNSAFARLFGFSSIEQVMQQDMRLFYPSIEHYAYFTDLLIRTNRLEYHEIEMRRNDGAPIYIVENVLGTFDANGQLVEIKGYIFDNTERKKLADQLQQAQRLESVGLLVSGIAHDFNNMLGGILGYTTRGLTRVTQSHPLYDNLYHIRDIANRAAKMTHQLLAFSRRQVLEPTDVNLNTIVENLLSFLGKLLQDHIEIDFVPAHDLKTVHVDYAQVEQVLMNLCVNAHDAMPNGGKITICTENVERGKTLTDGEVQTYSYVCLSVEDTGTGMSDEVRSHIFEPFFTTKDIGKGTGLGLSMVHGIVGQHNGDIEVESTQGKGTKFSIYLPTTENPPQQSLVAAEESSDPVRGGAETILVVEDDPDLRCLMEEALGEYGYKVMSAADGSEGLKLFKEYPDITLVVSDLVTPKMRGKDLYDKIHEISADTKFLFVSGYQANQISQNFVLDQGFEFLPKPFDLDDLAGKVREILG